MLRPLARRDFLLAALGAAACQKREPLPELGSVPEFSLLDQSGRSVTRASFDGSVWIAAFFFTRCPSICPRITRGLRALQLSAAARKLGVRFVSFSVDPENDTPAALTEYAQRYQADLANWSFLTGELETVKRTVVRGFQLALEGTPDAGAENFGIVHGSHLVLVDAHGKIRGYYPSEDDSVRAQLLDDAALLAK